MRGNHLAAFGLGLSALLATAFTAAVGPISSPAHAQAAPRPDDDDEEKPQKGPRLAPGKALGLALTLSRGDVKETRHARLVALGVPAGTPPSPFLTPGPFRATWQGEINLPFRSDCTFSAAGRGSIKVEVNGKVALGGSGDDLAKVEGKETRLKKGANVLVVTYDSPATGDALVRLSWKSEDFAREPLQPVALSHDANLEALANGRQLREGREALAGLRCLKCHAPASPVGGASSMPEMATDAPSFADIGSRLQLDWMARWIADPKSLRPTATMPRMFHNPLAGQAPGRRLVPRDPGRRGRRPRKPRDGRIGRGRRPAVRQPRLRRLPHQARPRRLGERPQAGPAPVRRGEVEAQGPRGLPPAARPALFLDQDAEFPPLGRRGRAGRGLRHLAAEGRPRPGRPPGRRPRPGPGPGGDDRLPRLPRPAGLGQRLQGPALRGHPRESPVDRLPRPARRPRAEGPRLRPVRRLPRGLAGVCQGRARLARPRPGHRVRRASGQGPELRRLPQA